VGNAASRSEDLPMLKGRGRKRIVSGDRWLIPHGLIGSQTLVASPGFIGLPCLAV
jgi:hypothetical protein